MEIQLKHDIISAYYTYGKNEMPGNSQLTINKIRSSTLYDIEHMTLMLLSYMYGLWSKTNSAFDNKTQDEIINIINNDDYKLINMI